MIAAIIVAAGSSLRMGVPKASLRLRGATFLQSIIDLAHSIELAPVVLVVGFDADKLLLETNLRGAIVARNSEPELGPIRSIGMGVGELVNHPVEATFVLQVDRPHILPQTLEVLASAFRQRRPSIVVPTFDGRRGHPVLFSRATFDELLDARHNQEGARSVVRRDPSRVLEIAVTDRAVLESVDTPQDYAHLIRSIDGSGGASPQM